MDGNLIPESDTFVLGNGQKRSRREYSELTVAMWACAAFSTLGPSGSKDWAEALLAFASEQRDSWGNPSDKNLTGRTGSTPNENYFEQFLAWFGAAVLSGRFSNVWDDLINPVSHTHSA